LNAGLPSNIKDLSEEQLSKIVSFLFNKICNENNYSIKESYLNQLEQIIELTSAFNDDIVSVIINNYSLSGRKETKLLIDIIQHESLFKTVELELLRVMNNRTNDLEYFDNTESFLYQVNIRNNAKEFSLDEKESIKKQIIKIFENHGDKITKNDKYIYCLKELVMPIRRFKVKEVYLFYRPIIERVFIKERYEGDYWEYYEEFDESNLKLIGFDLSLLIRDFASKEDLPILVEAYKTPEHSTALNILEALARIGGSLAKKILKEIAEGEYCWPPREYSPDMESEAEKLLLKYM